MNLFTLRLPPSARYFFLRKVRKELDDAGMKLKPRQRFSDTLSDCVGEAMIAGLGPAPPAITKKTDRRADPITWVAQDETSLFKTPRPITYHLPVPFLCLANRCCGPRCRPEGNKQRGKTRRAQGCKLPMGVCALRD